MKRLTLLAGCALAALVPALPVNAQQATDASSGISDIVVTAQRREESVQDVPFPISSFSSYQLVA